MNASEEEFIPDEHSEASAKEEDEAEFEESAAIQIKKLRERLKKAVEEKQEYLEGWQRARADFANYKREEAGLHADKEERIKSDVIEQLLPALDALELSLVHARTPELSIVEKQFLDALKRAGVEKFGALGEPFDPHKHEALRESATDDEVRDHTIESVHRAGYRAGDKIIRPAQVSVNIFKKL